MTALDLYCLTGGWKVLSALQQTQIFAAKNKSVHICRHWTPGRKKKKKKKKTSFREETPQVWPVKSDQYWNSFKSDTGDISDRRYEVHYEFSQAPAYHLDLNWDELKCRLFLSSFSFKIFHVYAILSFNTAGISHLLFVCVPVVPM